jgi:hypothetical protein
MGILRTFRKGALLLAPMMLALAASCGGPNLTCSGPHDCGGNPCCLIIATSTYRGYTGPTGVSCTSSPSACAPSNGLSTQITRLCTVDADCTAGGVITGEPKCCPTSVENHRAKTCQGGC